MISERKFSLREVQIAFEQVFQEYCMIEELEDCWELMAELLVKSAVLKGKNKNPAMELHKEDE